MTKANWENFGDVNPMEHGGAWVLKDEDREHCFYVIVWSPYDNEAGGVMSDGYVVVTDSWMEPQKVADYADWNQDTTPEQRAIDYMEYYGAANFGGEDVEMTEDEAVQYLYDREVFTDDAEEAEELNEDQQMARLMEAGQVNPYPSEDYDDDVFIDYDVEDEE